MREIIVSVENAALVGVEPLSLDIIRAPLTLDALPAAQALATLRRWEQALVPGGALFVSVVDFDTVCDDYKSGGKDPEETLMQSGNVRAIFNREKISNLLNMAGFEIVGSADGLDWKENRYLISVKAHKRLRPIPTRPMKDIHAIMSLPRVAWTETMGHVYGALSALEIPFTKSTGVFWSQSLQRMMQQIVRQEERPKYIMTIDFDSIFDERDIVRLWQIMETNPDIFALCPMQIGRDRDSVLMTALGKDGKPMLECPATHFHADTVDIGHGHFGLTLIRTEMLERLSLPWFKGEPNSAGEWGEGRIDDDIYFWRKARSEGFRIAACPKVRIGHLQLLITWPDDALRTKHQYVGKYYDDGRPAECMTY